MCKNGHISRRTYYSVLGDKELDFYVPNHKLL
ncbi:hypothetical protein [Campylobacter phage CJLB-10]|nr:hypothetical protein [Campylobacter phage CJLB-10]